MIDFKYTRVFQTESRPVETAATIDDEGIAMVFVKEGNVTKVRPSTGAAGEKFAGMSQARNVPPAWLPYFMESSVAVSETLELPRTPMTGQILVKVDGVALTVVAGAAASAAEVQLVGTMLTFFAGEAGKALSVQFMYEPTVTEARQIKGDVAVGGLSASIQDEVGLIVEGDVATSYYDASADFSSAFDVELGADGRFTVGGTGETPGNVTVVSAPSASSPMLVVNLR